MANYVAILEDEIANINHLLASIPFSPNAEPTHEYFLNVYRLSRRSLVQLNEQPEKFPIDSNRLLKLGISLGNLIKTLQLDEELHRQQHQQQKTFLSNLNGAKGSSPAAKLVGAGSSEYNPFTEPLPPTQIPKHIINTTPQSQPVYQIKFIKNLLLLLKNFDIGGNASAPQMNSVNLRLHELSNSQSSSTINQQLNGSDGSGGPGASSESSHNASPIKINSKQLLIEKLEINIKLDNLFIYKVLFKMILRIFEILRQNLLANNINEPAISRTSSNSEYEENSSIFSSTSANSSDSSSLIAVDEYLKILKQILNRILFGLVEPFVKLVLNGLMENSIQNDFNKLINSL
ncbi:uncharacterized protein CANTADRAFT_55018 [Suhomyces tanzawaensis NRRL Y-17324]|uniref:Uncharacterized protein n=1 Tax=Suhomyces tanzawaensis NRRL Y-17324 TaxID=984487 RepID=A0A1E4SF96_9ASCO|nr:uncharacterized protein CANTADRAFT_55018 [Suhomyces tanzawaensis NRRL Y-17324]ODV78201.1 hypothetical protein CANTADRAFT_55018 [Suhomyces tanzawaensis NRRL Y-17324]